MVRALFQVPGPPISFTPHGILPSTATISGGIGEKKKKRKEKKKPGQMNNNCQLLPSTVYWTRPYHLPVETRKKPLHHASAGSCTALISCNLRFSPSWPYLCGGGGGGGGCLGSG